MPLSTIFIKYSTLGISLKLNLINKYVKPNIKGVKINIDKINIKIFFFIKKNSNFEIIKNKIIAKITGTDEGRDAKISNIIPKIFK
jgi:hypothetical protein